jgi:uncharacterized protein
MLQIEVHIVIGMVVGMLVGLTGVGGGVILLPILIFGLRVPALVAVGSDAAFNAVTKIGIGYMHWRARTVDRNLVLGLSCGSLPGALLGVTLLNHLHHSLGGGVDHWLTVLIGALLVAVALLLLFQENISRHVSFQRLSPGKSFARTVLIGLLAGLVVGMTSIGSGSVIMVLLLLFLQTSPQTLVGTDIVHAAILTCFTSLLQLKLGNVDPSLVLALVIGSIPGAFVGLRLCNWLPSLWLRRVLCVVLLLVGARTLAP